MMADRHDQFLPRPLARRIVVVVGALVLLSLAFWIRALSVSDGDRHLAIVTWAICMTIVVALIGLTIVVTIWRNRATADIRSAEEAPRPEVP